MKSGNSRPDPRALFESVPESQNGMDGLPTGDGGTKSKVQDLAPRHEINSYCPSFLGRHAFRLLSS